MWTVFGYIKTETACKQKSSFFLKLENQVFGAFIIVMCEYTSMSTEAITMHPLTEITSCNDKNSIIKVAILG